MVKSVLLFVGSTLSIAAASFSLWFGWQCVRGASDDVPVSIDAIAVFAGGSVARLEHAMALQQRHPNATLYVNDAVAEWIAGAELTRQLCHGNVAVGEVVCVGALEDSTRGEMRAFAPLMNRRGHETVAVVSVAYHVPRVKRWMQRCFRGRVVGVGSHRQGVSTTALLHEVAGHWLATLLPARCNDQQNSNPVPRV